MTVTRKCLDHYITIPPSSLGFCQGGEIKLPQDFLFISSQINIWLIMLCYWLSWIKNMYQISFACFFIWLRTKWNRQVKALKKGNRWPAGGFCGNPWASPIKLTPFKSFSGFFCLEGCIVARRDVLKNAFPLAYKVQKM